MRTFKQLRNQRKPCSSLRRRFKAAELIRANLQLSFCAIKFTTTSALICGDRVLLSHEGLVYWPAGGRMPCPIFCLQWEKPADDFFLERRCCSGAAGSAWPSSTECVDGRRQNRCRKDDARSRRIGKQLSKIAHLYLGIFLGKLRMFFFFFLQSAASSGQMREKQFRIKFSACRTNAKYLTQAELMCLFIFSIFNLC